MKRKNYAVLYLLVILLSLQVFQLGCSNRIILPFDDDFPQKAQITCGKTVRCEIQESFKDFGPLFEAEDLDSSESCTVAIYKSHGNYFICGNEFSNVWIGKLNKKGIKVKPIIEIGQNIFDPEYLIDEDAIYIAFTNSDSKQDTVEVFRWEK